MKIYVLSGSSNSGKTNTLHTLALLLNSKPAKYRFLAGVSAPLPPALPVGVDQQYIFEKAGTSIKIGISTGGDTADVIDNGFDYFVQNGCDIGFIASKSIGASINQIEIRSSPNITPMYLWLVSSTSTRNQNQIQTDVAQQLESMI